jgi:hypothetical protein
MLITVAGDEMLSDQQRVAESSGVVMLASSGKVEVQEKGMRQASGWKAYPATRY